ncbi:hypothetical protein [Tahibacter amnicola]|uniref:Uncharacterized protein n=1 Tax=Tahibacter amnicola TaxID=2976241 RepID=A0ABY6BB65_9GAMM|nr:hypothetical protein [Tahibacter amnicola]UXI67293.1 hypothetical protein N4264_21525 [Tahibacter amnicola]
MTAVVPVYRHLLILLLGIAPAAAEVEPVLDSAAIVQPALLSGPGFTVSPTATVRGFMAQFEITTAFGPLVAESVELLAIRQAEIPAIEALERTSRTEAFSQALKNRAEKTGKAVWQVATHPIDTVTGLPAGVARYFVKQVNRWTNRAQSVSDRAAREFGSSGDPFSEPQAPMGTARASGGDASEKKGKAWYERAGKEVSREVKRQLDFGKMRRELAKHLGVDPYSSNPLLRERLDRLAWAAVGGNLSAGAALDSIGGAAAQVLSVTGQLNTLVWELDPENLREANRVRFARWCSDDFAVRQFLRRGGFTDTLRTSLADSVEALKPAAGCNDLVEIAAGTRTELEARYLVNALTLLRHHGGKPGGKLFVVGAAIVWRSTDGNLILPLPLDWMSWTDDMAAFFDSPQFAKESNKTLLLTGEASMQTQRELTRRGWHLMARTPYPGAPAYAADISQGLPQTLDMEPAQLLCVGDVEETAACL